MKVDEKTIKHVAEVARLNLTEGEIKKFLPQLKDILGYFSKMDKVNTDKTSPSFQPVEMRNSLREDREKKCFTQNEALKNSRNQMGYIKGPKAV